MKAIRKKYDTSVLLIHDDCIKTVRLRDTYNENGEKFGASLVCDYTFDNIFCTCMHDAICAYKTECDRDIEISIDGPETIIAKNINGERQPEIETFFNIWAKSHARYVKCKAITYKFAGNYKSKIVSIDSDIPHIPVYGELNERETQKYVDIYNRAEFPAEWKDKMKVCHVDDYLLVKMDDDIEVEYAKISKMPKRKSV